MHAHALCPQTELFLHWFTATTSSPPPRQPRSLAKGCLPAQLPCSYPPPATASAGPSAGGCAHGNVTPAPGLRGTWRKDFGASDMNAMRSALEAMKLSSIQKTAALKLIYGMQIEQDDPGSPPDGYVVKFLTKIPYYKVTERYRRGEATHMQRRDLRRGQQRAVAHVMSDDALRLEITWEGALPGRVDETFHINDNGQLEVRGVMRLDGRIFDVRQVYTRDNDHADARAP